MPMYLIERRPLTPELLARLVKAETYRLRWQNIFPTRDSWRHFLRSRRDVLKARGLVHELTAGHFVDAAALDAALPELLDFGHTQSYRDSRAA